MKKTVKVLITSLIVNTFLSLSKIIVGLIAKSNALIADGVHSFSDLTTDVIAITGSKFANKPADSKHPYGHGKLEYIISIIIGCVVLFLGLTIIFKGVNSELVVPSMIAIIVSVMTIVVKYILATYILKKGKEYKSNILISSGLESKADVTSSIVVLLSIIFMQLSKYNHIFIYADMIASIIVGLLIIKVAFDILKDNVSMILGEQETDTDSLDKIKKIILKDKLIKKIDSLVLLKYGSYYKLILEVSMDPSTTLLEVHNKIEEVENKLKKTNFNIEYITIHVNPYKKELIPLLI